jgi:hypothetical protein
MNSITKEGGRVSSSSFSLFSFLGCIFGCKMSKLFKENACAYSYTQEREKTKERTRRKGPIWGT